MPVIEASWLLERGLVRIPAPEATSLVHDVVGGHPDETFIPNLDVATLIRPPVDAYVRVLHPLLCEVDGADTGPLSWRSLGEGFDGSAGLDAWLEAHHDDIARRRLRVFPQIGSLEAPTERALATTIGETTSCYFFFHGLPLGSDVYRGLAGQVGAIGEPGSAVYVNPTAWWAVDGSWYVVTHPEADSTYVGCTEALAHRLVTARGLEAVEVPPHQPVWGSNIDTCFE